MFTRRKVIHAVVLLMLILFSAGIAGEFTSSKLHFPTHFDPAGIWLPVLSSSLSGVVFIRVRNRNTYRTIRTAPKGVQQLTNSFNGLATAHLTKGSFHVESNRACELQVRFVRVAVSRSGLDSTGAGSIICSSNKCKRQHAAGGKQTADRDRSELPGVAQSY